MDEISEGSPLGVAAVPLPHPKPVSTVPSSRRPPSQVLLSMYVPPHERIVPPEGMVTPDLQGAQEIIHCWSPFNQAERLVVHICDLYPIIFLTLVAARAEQYSIPFPAYLSKEAFQSVAEDEMFIRNHDFYRLAELVRGTLLGCYI